MVSVLVVDGCASVVLCVVGNVDLGESESLGAWTHRLGLEPRASSPGRSASTTAAPRTVPSPAREGPQADPGQ